MLSNLKKINELLTRRQRIAAVCLFGVMVLTGLMQVASVTSILPFMAVVSNPEMVETNRFLNFFYDGLGFTSTNQFLVFLGSVMLGAIIVVNALLAFGIWFRARFSWALNVHISKTLLAKYLSQPYLFFTTRNTSEFANAVLQETQQFTNGFVKPSLEFLAQSVTVLSLFLLVFFVDPLVAIVATVAFGGTYAAIYYVLRMRMQSIGQQRVAANKARFKSVQEAFGTVKETKILQRELHFVDGYERPARKLGRLMVLQDVISQTPRFVLESLAFGGMAALVLYFLITRGGVTQILPILSLYAFAGYRMMPALQAAFAAFSQVRFTQAVVDLIYRDMTENPGDRRQETRLQSQASYGVAGGRDPLMPAEEVLPFREGIELREVSFAYPETPRAALDNVSLTVPYHRSVAFCGPTGSGKTTAVDIILGLLEPHSGGLYVDGVKVTAENRRSWQRNLGYVPQSIYLSDSTIAQNIAFGVEANQIDHDAVRRAARIANISEFIETELPKAYDTLVGERGVRLSGGQRQRIGIARALYHDPEVLVLDEATSALDGATEESVMQAVRQVAEAKTVILIAHRLTTVKDCDTIFLLDHGRLVASGSYGELIENSDQFRKMARQSVPVG